ncbi:unnamed protein product [Closterium sp. NIES-54]
MAETVKTDWLPMVERQQDRLVKAIHTDRGGEFLSKEFSLWLKKNGIRHSLTMPYSPAMNGIAERANRTITETARGLLIEAGLPDYFWPDAVWSACMAKNRALTHVGADKWVPYVEWIGRKPKVDMLRVFGCMCMALVPKHLRHNKLGAKAISAVHLGMAQNSKGWLLWDPFTKKIGPKLLVGRAAELCPGRCGDGVLSGMHAEDEFSPWMGELLDRIRRATGDRCGVAVDKGARQLQLAGLGNGTSGMGLVLGGRGPVVLTGHADASWVDDLATQRSSQGYTFSLGSGSVSWWSTRSSSVLSSSCEAEIHVGAIAAQELCWLTYLLTDLGERPRSSPVLYVDNKAMIALCQEHRLEHRTKHIALRYFLARELQQRVQLRLAYMATRANTADIFTKELPPGDHQRFCTVLGLILPTLLRAAPCSLRTALCQPACRPFAALPCLRAALLVARHPALPIMASLRVLTFDHEGRPIQFDTWLDDLQMYLLSDSRDSVSLFDHTSGASLASPATTDTATRSQWLTWVLPLPLAPSYASATAVDVLGAEDVRAASASGKHSSSKGKGGKSSGGGSGGGSRGSTGGGGGSGGGGSGGSGVGSGGFGGGGGDTGRSGGSGGIGGGGSRSGAVQRGGSGGGQRQQQQRRSKTPSPLQLCEWLAQHGASEGSVSCPYVIRTDDAWRTEFVDEAERPRWAELLRSRFAIFDLDYDAILAAMYALSVSAEGDCYLCVPLDPGIEAAALGASESALPGTAPTGALHTFTLDSSASRCFFRDSTNLTPLSALVPVRLADPSGGPVLAHSSTVLPCPAVPSGSLPCLHLPSFSRNLVSTAALKDAMVTTMTRGGQRVLIYTCTRTGRHLATFTRRPGSSLYTVATEPPQVAASAQGREHYLLLVVDDYTRYTTVFLLRSNGEVPDVLIPLICAVRLELCERFRQYLPDLRLQSERGGEFSSDLLQDFCRGEGILQWFTLPASPQQNGIAEQRIGLVMELARTSMTHAAAPHFLWPFAVWYAVHQLNLWPRVSLPETSPTVRWTGKVGDVSVFRVWGSRAFVRDTSADKLSARAIPCVFLGFPPDASGWHFYHPTSRRVLSSQDITFDESAPFHRLFPYRSVPLSFPRRSSLLLPVKVAVDSSAAEGGATRGTESGGAEPAGAGPGGTELGGAELGGAELGGAEPERAEPGGAEHARTAPGGTLSTGGPSGALSRREPLSLLQLREWFARRTCLRSGAARAGGSTTGAPGPGVTGATRAEGDAGVGAGGTRSRAARAGCAAGAGAGGTGAGAAAGTGAGAAGAAGPGGGRTRDTRAGGAGPGGAGAVGAGFGDTARPRPYFRVPLPSPPASSLADGPDLESNLLRAASPTVTRLLATVVSDPSFESAAASALVAELVDFAAACRLDYAASLVAESESDCPPSIGGECALVTDVLEDTQEDFECFAAAVPHLVSMLIAREGDPDAPDIPTSR